MGHVKEHNMRDPNDVMNVYQWKEVRHNLPESLGYDPSMYWLANVWEDGRVAAELFIYMDDFRPSGPDVEECWRASRKAASTCNHLGIQDAPRKRCPWVGSMVYTDDVETGVRVLVSRKKWVKAKRLLVTLYGIVLASDWVDSKMLERTRGFLEYVARMYTLLTYFLMGLFMSIDGWKLGREKEGWSLRQAEVDASR
jgi:hypothetical protein